MANGSCWIYTPSPAASPKYFLDIFRENWGGDRSRCHTIRHLLAEKMNFFQLFFFELLPKFSDFVNSNDCIGKVTSKAIWLYPVFIKKKIIIIMKNRFFVVKKWEIQVIISMILLTPSSKRIFNPMRYTGWYNIPGLYHIYFNTIWN